MKRTVGVFGLLVVLLTALSSATHAQGTTWTGWISDSQCGAKGMNARHKACAQTCVKTNGASWVFVDSKDSRVYPIRNQNVVNADKYLGHPVTVQGRVNNDGTVSISTLGAAKS